MQVTPHHVLLLSGDVGNFQSGLLWRRLPWCFITVVARSCCYLIVKPQNSKSTNQYMLLASALNLTGSPFQYMSILKKVLEKFIQKFNIPKAKSKLSAENAGGRLFPLRNSKNNAASNFRADQGSLCTRMTLTPSQSTCKQMWTPQIPLSEDLQKKIQTRNSLHFLWRRMILMKMWKRKLLTQQNLQVICSWKFLHLPAGGGLRTKLYNVVIKWCYHWRWFVSNQVFNLLMW